LLGGILTYRLDNRITGLFMEALLQGFRLGQASMVAGDMEGQIFPIMPLNSQYRTGAAVIRPSASFAAQVLLESRMEFPHIMQQTGQAPLRAGLEFTGEYLGQIRHLLQVLRLGMFFSPVMLRMGIHHIRGPHRRK
jgi:hypothetical protein